ncbi:MAG: helix-turn-helix transcriptional regulator [Planctomycetes bacterium]|nr:helix-turn-helix transcriptional regulator [Planctomycetota bacterium]
MIDVQPQDIQPAVRMANYIHPEAGRGWNNRVIPDFELILVVAGRYGYDSPGHDPVLLPAGRVLCIPPGPHSFYRIDRAKRSTISCIHCELSRQGTYAAGDYRLTPRPQLVTDVTTDSQIENLFRRCAEAFTGYSRYRTALVETIAREIWLRLAEHWSDGDVRPVSRRMELMIDYLRRHLSTNVSRRDLAQAFSVTPEHVNALFKKELGMTPTQFVHRERCLSGYRLMRDEGLSVKEAARATGFSDAFHFSKVFKRIMGLPPSHV